MCARSILIADCTWCVLIRALWHLTPSLCTVYVVCRPAMQCLVCRVAENCFSVVEGSCVERTHVAFVSNVSLKCAAVPLRLIHGRLGMMQAGTRQERATML